MSEGAPSEQTPEPGGMKAIEDAGPKDGLMRPAGPPVVLGPENWNPFWSEKMHDEAVLRALRPVDLPTESPESASCNHSPSLSETAMVED